MADKRIKTPAAPGDAKNTSSAGETVGSKTAMSRRSYLKTTAMGVAGAGAAALAMPAIARAENKTWKLKLQSNWTGIGIESQDRAVGRFVDRVNKLSGGRIEVTNFDAEVLLGIGETFNGVGTGVADLAVTASIYHRGTVPVGEYLWSVPFFPVTNVEFYETMYQFMGLKELWREAYAPHNVMHLSYTCSDEWGAMMSTRPVESYADFQGMKVRAFGIWAEWLVKNGASIVVLPGGEIYTAIQTKILDAARRCARMAWPVMKCHEAASITPNPVEPAEIGEQSILEDYKPRCRRTCRKFTSAARVYNLISLLTIPNGATAAGLADGAGADLMPDEEIERAADCAGTSYQQRVRCPIEQ